MRVCHSSGDRQVAVIGLDGVSPHLLFERWRAELPHLSALMRRGVWGSLRSCDPPITVPAWASMLSGQDPGQLGLYGFRNRRAYTYEDYGFASTRSVRADRVWDILSRAGKRVVLLGVPPTYPPPALNGVVVSCFLTPSTSSVYTYPPSLQGEVERVADGYVFDVDNFRTPDKRDLLGRIYEKTRKHFRVARYLVDTQPWDFFMMVEMGPDRVHHGFWKHTDPLHPQYVAGSEFADAIRDYYRYLDGEVGELLACIDPHALVLVVSDHGAQRMDGAFALNEWLMRMGYLTLTEPPEATTLLRPAHIDWSATRAWAEGGYYGRLFLNVKGREPQGIIDPRDYERVRSDLMAAIAALAGPAGEPLFGHAHRPEDLYKEVRGVPPDLLVYLGDLRWRCIGSVGRGHLYGADNDTGPDDANHDWDGIFIGCNGDTDDGGVQADGLQLMDVAPTILHHYGLPIPADMAGTVIGGMARDATRRRETADGSEHTWIETERTNHS